MNNLCMVQILGSKADQVQIEYILECLPAESLDRVQEEFFTKLESMFIQDYEHFLIVRKPISYRADKKPIVLLMISDPLKNNVNASIRMADTLYSNRKKLSVCSHNMNQTETLYGNTVGEYLDKHIRAAFAS
jgi:hypothetical protein